MRLFVHADQDGNILSAMKVKIMAEEVEHPYGGLKEGDVVLEVEPTPELEALDSHQIGENYTVDVQNKQLKSKG